MALCPVHNDHRPSLSITAKDGVTLIHCFAGCDAVDVLKAVGLTFDDLWDEHNMSFESFGRHYGQETEEESTLIKQRICATG